jgi:hypothetical protein
LRCMLFEFPDTRVCRGGSQVDLKKQRKGYQSRMNAILRREMLASLKVDTKAGV